MNDDVPFDLLVVGFGPASLAIAIALIEREREAKVFSSLGGLQSALASNRLGSESIEVDSSLHRERLVRSCFVEESHAFEWHANMMLDGSRMQISFMKDLVTLRNPTSQYSFLAYLHSFNPSRLVSFISLGTFSPTRREYSSYMRWAARKVEAAMRENGSEIDYGERVIRVEAVVTPVNGTEVDEEVKMLRVTSRVIATGEERVRTTKNLVISSGGSANIPQVFQFRQGETNRIIHTSNYLAATSVVLKEVVDERMEEGIRIGVIGAGQSSAETFLALRSAIGSLVAMFKDRGRTLGARPQIDLFIRNSTLRPADSSEFSNEVFDPGMSQAVYELGSEERKTVMTEARGTNYSVVNPTTISAIYAAMYAQKVEDDIAASDDDSASATTLLSDPLLVIHPYSEVVETRLQSKRVQVTIRNSVVGTVDIIEYDALILGTGYTRSDWKQLLFPPTPTLSAVCASSSSPRSFNDLFISPLPSDLIPSISSSNFSTRRRSPDSSFSSPSLASDGSESDHTSPASSRSGGKVADELSAIAADNFEVKKNYRLDLPERFTTPEGTGVFRPTVWLQGCNESTHGISDSLLSVLAVRSGEVVDAILRKGHF